MSPNAVLKQPGRFLFEISSFGRGGQAEDGKQRKGGGRSEAGGKDTGSVCIEIDLREALGEEALQELLEEEGNSGVEAEALGSSGPSGLEEDPREGLRGFVLVGDLLAGQPRAQLASSGSLVTRPPPVSAGNISDVANICTLPPPAPPRGHAGRR